MLFKPDDNTNIKERSNRVDFREVILLILNWISIEMSFQFK